MPESSSSQSQSQTDRRIVAGEGAVTATEGSTLNYSVLDNGAISRAFDTADGSLDQAFSFGGNALAFVKQSTAQALDNLQATQKLTADAYNDAKGRGALTDKLLIGAVAAMGLVAYAAVKKAA